MVLQAREQCSFWPRTNPVSTLLVEARQAQEYARREASDERTDRLSRGDALRQQQVREACELKYLQELKFTPAINPRSRKLAQVQSQYIAAACRSAVFHKLMI